MFTHRGFNHMSTWKLLFIERWEKVGFSDLLMEHVYVHVGQRSEQEIDLPSPSDLGGSRPATWGRKNKYKQTCFSLLTWPDPWTPCSSGLRTWPSSFTALEVKKWHSWYKTSTDIQWMWLIRSSPKVEIVYGQQLVHGVAADKERNEIVIWLLVSFYHEALFPETFFWKDVSQSGLLFTYLWSISPCSNARTCEMLSNKIGHFPRYSISSSG